MEKETKNFEFSKKIKTIVALSLMALGVDQAQAYDSLKASGFNANIPSLSEQAFTQINSIYQSSARFSKKTALFSAYSPQYPLWSDGTKKRRWIYLPPNGVINTDNPDDWIFPVGTKIWKEFSYDQADGSNHKLETRLMEKRQDGSWLFETFVWNENQTSAYLAPEEGIKDFYPLDNNKYYDIPSTHDCEYCHAKAGLKAGPQKNSVLGFSALQLSDNRDPNAIHGEPLSLYMLSLSTLQTLGRTSTTLAKMPSIPSSEKFPLQRAALGYLHGNCGHCHNPSGMAEFTNTLDFFHPATAEFIQLNGTYKSAISKSITRFLSPAGSPQYIIDPGFPEQSALIYRMTEEEESYTFKVPNWHHSAGFSLNIAVKMPFVGTNIIDEEAVNHLKEYIRSLSKED